MQSYVDLVKEVGSTLIIDEVESKEMVIEQLQGHYWHSNNKTLSEQETQSKSGSDYSK